MKPPRQGKYRIGPGGSRWILYNTYRQAAYEGLILSPFAAWRSFFGGLRK